ncbi:MAG: hypothetical protein ACLVAU_06950 [Ruminococcus sp.]
MAAVQMHVKEEIIERIALMNDYLEPYEDMSAYSLCSCGGIC